MVIASIYINPTQFTKNEDFGLYPRSTVRATHMTLSTFPLSTFPTPQPRRPLQEEDLRKLSKAGCVAVFMPKNLYHVGSAAAGSAAASSDGNAAMVVGVQEQRDPGAHETWVALEHLSQGLCARTRPHFFRGVCTVVTKLFHIVEPDLAFFGKKDYQQWRVIERMVRDLDFGLKVVGMPIVREADGLAMSSRNALLAPEGRQRVVCISQALAAAKEAGQQGTVGSAAELAQQVASHIEQNGGRVDYVDVVDAHTLQLVSDVRRQPTLIAVAAFFDSVRLIDNIELTDS